MRRADLPLWFAAVVVSIIAVVIALSYWPADVRAADWYVTVNEPAPIVYGQGVSFTATVPKQFFNKNRKPQYPITSSFQVDCLSAPLDSLSFLVKEDFAAVASRKPISGGWLVITEPLPMSGPLWPVGQAAHCGVTVWYVDNGPNSGPTFVIVSDASWEVVV